jgi:hypothetical protein
MTHADRVAFAKDAVFVFVIFYVRAWSLESARTGSWRKGHANLWRRPKRWQVVTFCILWTIIIAAFVFAFTR